MRRSGEMRGLRVVVLHLATVWATLVTACGGASHDPGPAQPPAPPLPAFPNLPSSAEWIVPEGSMLEPADAKLEAPFVRISDALADAGIPASAFYHLGDRGFAVVTLLEAIDEAGQPTGEDRWRLQPPAPSDEDARLERHDELLADAPPGRYRAFAVIVAPPGAGASDAGSGPSAMELLAMPPAPDTQVRIEVYEYHRADQSAPATLVNPASVAAEEQVRASGLWAPAGPDGA